MAGPEQFGRLNIWAMLKAMLNQNVAIFVFDGTPVNGTSGTFANFAGRGSLLIDFSTGVHYINVGTKASPNWAVGLENVTSPLTAFAGGGQALATQLNVGINNVTVVATAADSVKLPLAVAGEQVTVRNNSATAMQVFGFGTDTINGIATAVGISQPADTVRVYNAVVSGPGGNWLVDVVDIPAPGASQFTLGPGTAQAGDGALNPDLDGTYIITKGSAAALTLAAPANPGSNGKTITVTSNTAFAHTITTATLLDTGTALTTSVVFDAFAGASVMLMAWAGRWKIIAGNKFTLT